MMLSVTQNVHNIKLVEGIPYEDTVTRLMIGGIGITPNSLPLQPQSPPHSYTVFLKYDLLIPLMVYEYER